MRSEIRQVSRLRTLLKTIALQRGPFVLSSGKTSSYYLDCRRVTLDPEGAFLIGSLLFNRLTQGRPKVAGVGGPTMGADPIVSAITVISQLKKKPLGGFYVRKEPKSHGMAQWVEKSGRLRVGAKVAIVEDVVTSGGSIVKAIERARLDGFHVVRAMVVVDREEGGREAVEAAGIPLESLFKVGELLK
ncbi:MAG: orotate phosphoribosyltransferase [Nitrospirae bacterium]|nr:orotate phosphoribosyltransferase [Nitrospirota bacterium]